MTDSVYHVPLAALAEPGSTAVLLVVLGTLLAVSVLFSRTVDRLGVPIVLLFMILGVAGGSEGIGGLAFDNYALAVRLGTIALVLILFDGGLNTSLQSFRAVLYPAGLLATLGVALTAVLVGLCAWSLGMPVREAFLLGAVVSSTDAAAVFAVLRGGRLDLQQKLGRTLEVESCINDPMAVILTVSMIQVMTSETDSVLWLVAQVPLQLLIGGAVGLVVGWIGRWLLSHFRLTTVGLYPALTAGLAFLSFGVATIVQGSGFLAVYVTAIWLGNGVLPYRSGLTRVHDSLAWLSQIGMFLMLGLLVFPSRLWEVAGVGLGVGLFLSLIARPLAVLPCLLPFGYRPKEIVYVGLMGLRGAVPIILATFPVLAGVEGGERIFNAVFFIVVVSTLVPGATIRTMTRWMRFGNLAKPLPAAVIELNSSYPLSGDLLSFTITPELAVCDASLRDIAFPAGASILMVVRGKDLLPARGDTRLQSNDHVYVFCRPEDRGFIELLFGRPEESGLAS